MSDLPPHSGGLPQTSQDASAGRDPGGGAGEPCAVPFVRPELHVDAALMASLEAILRSGQVSNHGSQAQAFEQEMGAWFSQPVALCGSGTAGLTAGLLALGRRGKAILPAFTYIATRNAVLSAGLQPLYGDIDLHTWTLCPRHLEALLQAHGDVAVVVAVTVFGVTPDLAALAALTEPRGIALVVDDAHGWGSESRDYARADLRVLSLHATKNLAAVEGGVILARDPALLQAARLRVHHGLDHAAPLDSVHGGNFRMSELHAAVGRQNLRHLADNLRARRDHAERLAQLVDGLEGLERQGQRPGCRSGWQNFGARLALADSGAMDAAVADLQARGVMARRYFWPPLHRLAGAPPCALPVTDALMRQQLCLPLFHHMHEAHHQHLARVLPAWLARWRAARLPEVA